MCLVPENGTRVQKQNLLIKERQWHLEQNNVLHTDNHTSYYTQQSSYNYSKQQNKTIGTMLLLEHNAEEINLLQQP